MKPLDISDIRGPIEIVIKYATAIKATVGTIDVRFSNQHMFDGATSDTGF